MISKRAQKLFTETPPLVDAHFRCAQDPFDAEANPNGFVNLGTAENFLPETQLLDKLAQAPALTAKQLHYDISFGSQALRETYTQFMQRFLNVSMPPQLTAVTSGVSAAVELLAHVMFDAGDNILTLAPVYSGFFHDFELRPEVELTVSHAMSINGELDIGQLNADILKHKPKALLINNPHNPLGICYTTAQISQLIILAKQHSIEIIADEIYANSVFGDVAFKSFLHPDFAHHDYQQHIHQLYGMAKDFALSGFKVGFIASHNEQVMQAVQSVCYFHPVSTQTQQAMAYLLGDLAWCEEFFAENCAALRETFESLQQPLQALHIRTNASNAGIFTMLDLRPWLTEQTQAAEFALFETLLQEAKVSISPGQFFDCNEPGWFRLCYAKPQIQIDTFIERLQELRKSM